MQSLTNYFKQLILLRGLNFSTLVNKIKEMPCIMDGVLLIPDL